MKKTFFAVVAALAAFALAALAAAPSAICAGVKALGEKAHAIVFGYMANNGLVLHALLTPADAYTGKYPVRTQPISSELLEVTIPFNFPAANPGVGDIQALVKVPPNVRIVDYTVITDDADSNGVPTLAFSLGSLNAGQTDLATTYLAASTIGSTGGLARAASNAHFLESNAAERAIGLKYTASAATYVAGKTGVLVLRLEG